MKNKTINAVMTVVIFVGCVGAAVAADFWALRDWMLRKPWAVGRDGPTPP